MTSICSICGGPSYTSLSSCSECRENAAIDRYPTLPAVEWDEQTPAYSDALDLWFFSLEEISDYQAENGASWTPERMRLHPTVPTAWTPLNADQWGDDLAGCDGEPEIPDQLYDLVREFNEELADIPTGTFQPDMNRRLIVACPTKNSLTD